MKMFKVNAGYSKDQINKNYYYVLAESKQKAKSKFAKFVSWLNIFSIEECSQEEYKIVMGNQSNYSII